MQVEHRDGGPAAVLVDDGVVVADARADDERLPPFADVLADALPRGLEPLRSLADRDHRALYRRTSDRELSQGRHLEVAVHGYRDRARDGCRCHHEHVRWLVALRPQRIALL